MEVRTRIGMVFQKPNPFPKSIYSNITWGPRIHGYRIDYDHLVEDCLKRPAYGTKLRTGSRILPSAFRGDSSKDFASLVPLPCVQRWS